MTDHEELSRTEILNASKALKEWFKSQGLCPFCAGTVMVSLMVDQALNTVSKLDPHRAVVALSEFPVSVGVTVREEIRHQLVEQVDALANKEGAPPHFKDLAEAIKRFAAAMDKKP